MEFKTDRVLKLDADGNMIMGDGININLRIKNLTRMEKIQLLPFIASMLCEDISTDFTVVQLTKILNQLIEKAPLKEAPKMPPVWIKGKVKTQTVEEINTGIKCETALIVELADLVKMGRVGLAVRIQNMEKEEKLSLLKLIARDLRAEKKAGE